MFHKMNFACADVMNIKDMFNSLSFLCVCSNSSLVIRVFIEKELDLNKIILVHSPLEINFIDEHKMYRGSYCKRLQICLCYENPNWFDLHCPGTFTYLFTVYFGFTHSSSDILII